MELEVPTYVLVAVFRKCKKYARSRIENRKESEAMLVYVKILISISAEEFCYVNKYGCPSCGQAYLGWHQESGI